MTGKRAPPKTRGRRKQRNGPGKTQSRNLDPIRHGVGPVVPTEDIVIPFLDFPLAVRTQIFMYMFAPTGFLDPGDNIYLSRGYKIPPVLNTLRACRSIHDEATAVLYGMNEFIFSIYPEQLESWLNRIGPRNASHVTKVCMHCAQGNANHKKCDQHYQDWTGHIDVLRLAPNCALRFDPSTICTEETIRAACRANSDLQRTGLTLRRLADEPCIEVYQRLNLMRCVCLSESGRHGFIEFRTHDERYRWKQEFLIRDPPPIWIKQETKEHDGVMCVEEAEYQCILDGQETVEFLHQRKGLSDLPDFLITQILGHIVGPLSIVERHLFGDHQVISTSDENWDDLDLSPVTLPFPRGLRASKRLLDLALRMYYSRTTFVFHVSFRTAHVGRAHNLENIFTWMERCEHRKHARQVRITLHFGRHVALHEICINIFAYRHWRTWEASLDVLFCFEAGESVHSVSLDQMARNISKILYSAHEDSALDRCLVDGYGNARLYTEREKQLDAIWSRERGLVPMAENGW